MPDSAISDQVMREVERLLPCAGRSDSLGDENCFYGHHESDCPGRHRESVARVIQDRDDRFGMHTKAVQQFLGEVCEILSIDLRDGKEPETVKEGCASIILHLTADRQATSDRMDQLSQAEKHIRALLKDLRLRTDARQCPCCWAMAPVSHDDDCEFAAAQSFLLAATETGWAE